MTVTRLMALPILEGIGYGCTLNSAFSDHPLEFTVTTSPFHVSLGHSNEDRQNIGAHSGKGHGGDQGFLDG